MAVSYILMGCDRHRSHRGLLGLFDAHRLRPDLVDAAKEAFVKALGTGFFGSDRITPRGIWVCGAPRPEFGFSERVRKVMSARAFSTTDLSPAHHADYALATVVLS